MDNTVRSRESLRILVVDDSELQLQFEQALLADEPYDLIVARNGVEAIARARRYRPDLILLDIVMPVMDGIQAAHRLRQDPSTAKIPIIMVTSRVDIMSSGKMIIGCNDFVAKPVLREELLSKIRSLTRH